MLVIPTVGLLELLTDLFNALYVMGNVVTLHLYQNNVVPAPNDTLATYTEATFDGYAAQNLARVGTPFINSNGLAEQDFQILQFMDTGATTPNTVYGYWVQFTTGGGPAQLLWSERFPSPVTMDHAGATVDVGCQFTGQSEF